MFSSSPPTPSIPVQAQAGQFAPTPMQPGQFPSAPPQQAPPQQAPPQQAPPQQQAPAQSMDQLPPAAPAVPPQQASPADGTKQQLATLFPGLNVESPEAVQAALSWMANMHSNKTTATTTPEEQVDALDAELDDPFDGMFSDPSQITAGVKKLMTEHKSTKKALAEAQSRLKGADELRQQLHTQELDRRSSVWADSIQSDVLGHSSNPTPTQRLVRKGLQDTALDIAREYSQAGNNTLVIEQALALAAARTGLNIFQPTPPPQQQAPPSGNWMSPSHSLPPSGPGMMTPAPARESSGTASGIPNPYMSDAEYLAGARAILAR